MLMADHVSWEMSPAAVARGLSKTVGIHGGEGAIEVFPKKAQKRFGQLSILIIFLHQKQKGRHKAVRVLSPQKQEDTDSISF